MKKEHYPAKDEIDVTLLILKLWKEKIFILIVSIFCMLLTTVYSYINKPNKQFITIVNLKSPPVQLFQPYNFFYNFENESKFLKSNYIKIATGRVDLPNSAFDEYTKLFHENLVSKDNLYIYLDQNSKLDNFKKFIQKKNIDLTNFLEVSANLNNSNDVIASYKLFHTKEIDGPVFFNDYVEFVKKKTLEEFFLNIRASIKNTIDVYEQALVISKTQSLKKTTKIDQDFIGNKAQNLSRENTETLEQQINYFKKKLESVEFEKYNYNVILDKASSSLAIKNNSIKLKSFFGFVFGFFLSLLLIYFKEILQNNK
jgi:LPS O-antigen subunit length determinant protein (WzzB/FepE family)